MKHQSSSLINNLDVIRWCYEGITPVSLMTTQNEGTLKPYKQIEDQWGNSVINSSGGSQWTTQLCQGLVLEALAKLGRSNVRKATPKQASIRAKQYAPDLECDDYVYEVKGRNWTTTGTAGEKILGVPLKYGEIPRLYKKPLQIILVGYQEYEAKKGWAFGNLLDASDQTEELKESLAFYKEHNIEYVALTDVLKRIGCPYGCWKK